MPLPGGPIAAPRQIAIFDRGTLLRQLELVYGRRYMFDDEVELGLPQPSLSNEEQFRLDKLRWLADDQRGSLRPLLFGSQAIRDRLAQARLASPNVATVIDLIDRAVALSVMTGTALTVPPILLLGPPGVGKTHASKAIATALGTAIQAISCAANSDAQQLVVGHPTSWRGARMSVVNEALLDSDIAQPVLLLDEIDKFESHRDEQPYNMLLNLLEPENSGAILDEYLRVPFDLSHAIIVATANDADRLPSFIQDRLLMVEIAPPLGADLLGITRRIVADAIAQAGGAIAAPCEEVIARLARAHPRQIKRIVRLALGYAAEAGRCHLIVTDVEAAERLAVGTATRDPIGFLQARG
ncbi:AAA family ATPase [Bosea sp. AAP35]|uniref:AAA family ATPase n=1 Tax=Bosea sp. AAP35 TaxID=1523417 RepID=UPI0006B8C912|nr:AAA family ATPase [Bosea sp. AAP35]